MALAELALEKTPAQHIDDLADYNRLGRPRQRVAAFFTARRRYKTGFPQDAQDLRGIGRGNTLRLADLRNRQTAAFPGLAEPHKAAQAVLFVRG